MSPHLDRLQREHRRLDRLIDQSRHATTGPIELRVLKRLRLAIRDRIAHLQRSAADAP